MYIYMYMYMYIYIYINIYACVYRVNPITNLASPFPVGLGGRAQERTPETSQGSPFL